jgi:uncharacterized protein YndB with AHSA1/START domain
LYYHLSYHRFNQKGIPMSTGKIYSSSVYITTTPQKAWQAIIDPDLTRLWYFDTSVESLWKAGSPIVHRRGGSALFEGAILEIDEPHLLVTTFSALFHPQAREERPCRLTWRVERVDPDVRLTATYDDIGDASATASLLQDGLAYQLHSLKAIWEDRAAHRGDLPWWDRASWGGPQTRCGTMS